MKRVFMKCVRIVYATTVASIQGQNAVGSGVSPRAPANGEYGRAQAMAITVSVVSVSGQLARLWMKGIRLVRMMCTISVCVRSDSTNPPVGNSLSKGAFSPGPGGGG